MPSVLFLLFLAFHARFLFLPFDFNLTAIFLAGKPALGLLKLDGMLSLCGNTFFIQLFWISLCIRLGLTFGKLRLSERIEGPKRIRDQFSKK